MSIGLRIRRIRSRREPVFDQRILECAAQHARAGGSAVGGELEGIEQPVQRAADDPDVERRAGGEVVDVHEVRPPEQRRDDSREHRQRRLRADVEERIRPAAAERSGDRRRQREDAERSLHQDALHGARRPARNEMGEPVHCCAVFALNPEQPAAVFRVAAATPARTESR